MSHETVNNPFQAPRAPVRDVFDGEDSTAEPKIFSAKGRIGRLRLLAYTMGGYLVFLVAITIFGGMGAMMSLGLGAGGAGSEAAVPGMLATLVMVVGAVAYLVLTFMWYVQRCHDMDWSGWACLLVFVPLLNLLFIFKGGTAGANRFGPPPTPNPLGVKLLALTLPVIAIIGIVAAVTIPAMMGQPQQAQQLEVKP